jgi:hypothetical protein
VNFKAALAAVSSRPLDPAALDQLAKEALRQGEEESALPLLDGAAVAMEGLARALDRRA